MGLKRAAIAGLFFLLSVSSTSIGLVCFQQATMERQVSNLLSNIADLNVAAIRVDPWLGRVEVEAAVVAGAATKLRVGRATIAVPLSVLAFGITPANAFDSTVAFENVSADFGLWQVEIPSLVISGTSASKADIAAFFDPKAITSIAERLAKFNAKAIDIPTIELTQPATLGSNSTTVLRSISARDIQRGKIATITMASADLESKVQVPAEIAAAQQKATSATEPSVTNVKGSYGPATITNLNLAGIFRIMTEVATSDEAPLTLYDRYVVDHFDFSVIAPSARIEVSGAANSGTAKGRPMRIAWSDLPKISQKRKAGLEPSPQENAEAFARAAELFTAFQLSSEVNNLIYKFISPQQSVAGKIAKIAVSLADNGMLQEGVEGFTLDGQGVHVGLGSAAYSVTLGSAMKTIAEAIGRVTQNQKPSSQDVAAALAKVPDILKTFETSTEVKDLSYKVNLPDHRLDGRVGLFAFSVGQNATIHGGLDGFAIDGEGAHINLGKVGLDGELGSAIKALAQSAARGEDGIKSANPRSFVPHLSNFILSDIDVNTPAPKKDGNADNGNRIVLGLNRFEVSSSNTVENIPTVVSVILDRFKFELPKTDPGLKDLIALGYTKVNLSSAINLAWNEATRQLAVNNLALSDPEMGVIGVNGTIDNVSRSLFAGSTTEIQTAAMAIALKAVDIKIENKGLYEKLIAKQAHDQQKSPEEIRAAAAKLAAFVVLWLLGDTPREHAVAAAVSNFMADPKSLHVVARSAEGLTPSAFFTLQDLTELMNKIELSANANQ